MSSSIEIIVLLAGIAALIFSAITLHSLDKLKACATGADKKQYDTAKHVQIAQIVVSSLVVILSGWVVASGLSNKAGKGSIRGANTISQWGRKLAGL